MKYSLSITHIFNKKEKKLLPHFVGFEAINGVIAKDEDFYAALTKFIIKLKDEKRLGESEIKRAVALKIMPTAVFIFRKKEDKEERGVYFKTEALLPLLLEACNTRERINEVAQDLLRGAYGELF